jgi:hypothetical protein
VKISRTYTFQKLVPVAGLSIGGIALGAFAFSVTPQHSVKLTDSSQSATQSEAVSQELPNVTVNGTPLTLDANGDASVKTPDGATVNVNSDGNGPSITSTVTSGSGSNTSTDSVHIVTGTNGEGSGQTTSSSTSRIRISGNSSSSSSSYSHTSVMSNGEGDITVSN